MPVGDLILAKDYNDIRNKIIAVLGVGSGNQGYGQRIQSAEVATTNRVTKAQWDLLRFDIYNVLVHQTGTVPSVVTAILDDVIKYGLANPNNQYDNLSNTAVTNRFNVGAGQFGETLSVATTTRTTAWNTSITARVTVSFAGGYTVYVDDPVTKAIITRTATAAEHARHFFNAGGRINIRSSRSGGAATAQNSSWSSILSSAGTRSFGGQLPTAGFGSANGSNFHRIDTTARQYYTTTGSSPYATNRYSLLASRNTDYSIVYLDVKLDDPYVDPPVGIPPASTADVGPEDVVDGTLTSIVDIIFPTGQLQPAPATGNFTLPLPTISFGSFTGS
jgi:hypothetical protein